MPSVFMAMCVFGTSLGFAGGSMLCIKFLLISIESLTLGTKEDSISQNIPLGAG